MNATRLRRSRTAPLVFAVVAVVVLSAVLVLGGPWAWAAPSSPGSVGGPAETGLPAPRWSTPVSGWPFAVAADKVGVVAIGGNDEVLALSSDDGSTAWYTTVTGTDLHRPALGAGAVAVSATDYVTVLDRKSGERRWDATIPGGAGPVRIVQQASLVLVGTGSGSLLALDLASGAPRWESGAPGSLFGPPALGAEGSIVVATWHGGPAPAVRALDTATGVTRWEAPIGRSSAAPVVAGDLAFVAEGDSYHNARVVARALSTGVEVWSAVMPGSFEAAIEPAASDDAVAVVDHFGTATLLDTRTGALRWRTEIGEPVLHTRVLLTRRAVVLSTFPGTVVALDRRSGRARFAGVPDGFPADLARSGTTVVMALRITDPGRIEAVPLR